MSFCLKDQNMVKKTVAVFTATKDFTMESLILAQDER